MLCGMADQGVMTNGTEILGNLQDLAILAPFLAVAGILGGLLTFIGKLLALWAKNESGSSLKEKAAVRFDLLSSLIVAAVGVAALIAVSID